MSKPSRPPAQIMSQFLSAEKGVILLPQFTKYAFQDAAMTIPAVVGMPVAKMVCPATGVVTTLVDVTMQQDARGVKYLQPNGTSSYGQTTAINFGTDKITLHAAARKTSDAAGAMLMELSTNAASSGSPGSFYVTAPETTAGLYGFRARGASAVCGYNSAAHAAPHAAVLSAALDLAGADVAATVVPNINGIVDQTTLVGTPSGGGNFGNYVLNLFARNGGSLFFGGPFYGAIVRGAASTAGTKADTDAYLAKLVGVSF